MVRFVGEDKMTPAQRALEHARFELSCLHGCTITRSGNGGYSEVFDSSELMKLIDEALETMPRFSEQDISPECSP